jgi:integrase
VQTRKILKGCRFTRCDQIDNVRIDKWLAEQRRKGIFGQSTSLKYWQSIKQFCRWATRNRRFPYDPLLHVSIKTREIPRDRERRVASDDEFNRLLHAAAAGKTTHRLTGRQRMFVYLVAAETGLRASELASLRPSSFDLAAILPFVKVACTISRRRKTDRIELRPETAQILRPFLDEVAPDDKLWPGKWHGRGAETLRVDLDAAGIKYETPTGTLDFHALRHTFTTGVAMSGAPMSIVQEICRLSTPSMVRRYFHAPDTAHTRVLASLPKRSLPEDDGAGA